jgi:hypothetical protein
LFRCHVTRDAVRVIARAARRMPKLAALIRVSAPPR